MANDRMTAAEAERRYDSTRLTGGTYEQRKHALKRWRDALVRESTAHLGPDEAKRRIAKAVR